MSQVITLSSDEESAPEPPRKKIKPTFLGSAIRITKVTTVPKSVPEKEKKASSLSEILASSSISKSISITPVAINNNSVKHSNGTVIQKPIRVKKNSNARISENIVVLSDDEDLLVNDKLNISETSPKPIPVNDSEAMIILDEYKTHDAKDSESDDDCMIVDKVAETPVDKTDTRPCSEVSDSKNQASAFVIVDSPKSSETAKASVRAIADFPHASAFAMVDSPQSSESSKAEAVEEPKANAFAIEDLPPPALDHKSNSFEIVELTETDNVPPIVDEECSEKEVVIRLDPCDRNRTKQGTDCKYDGEGSQTEKKAEAESDTNESASLTKEEDEVSAEQELKASNSSSDAEGCSSNKENSVDEDASTSVVESAGSSLLEKYIEVCQNAVKGSRFEDVIHKKLDSLRSNYKKCGAEEDSSQFKKMLEDNIGRAEKSATMAAMSFKEVFQLVKDLGELGIIEVTREEKRNLKKLEKTLKLLSKKIKKLEQAEVDFDMEEDSKFLQLARYNDRFVKVHKKYCSLLKKNPYSGRLTYSKLDFVDSEYNEINRAISKKFKDNSKFPSFLEVENLIKKVAEEHKLNFSESKLRSESVHCFKKLGELLQSRRKKELYEDHYLTIGDTEDPAAKDYALNTKLIESCREGAKRIDEICEKFTNKQERGVEPDVSEGDGSDKSDYVDSD